VRRSGRPIHLGMRTQSPWQLVVPMPARFRLERKHMTRSWILGPLTVILLAGCGGGAQDRSTSGGAGTETGSPGMTSDTSAAAAPAPGATPSDTAMTGGADTSQGAAGMAKDTTDTSKTKP
jgi:hypothetical protein